MINTRFYAGLAAILLLASSAFSQYQPVSSVSSKLRLMPVSEVREGMRGTARTVFHGNKPEEFNVEILGVMPDWIGPKQDMIVGRLSGALAERTFVFAGMSGSPVYVDGKLIGAISYSFPFAKEPICGITPIEQMISIVEQGSSNSSSPSQGRPVSLTDLSSDLWKPVLRQYSAGSLASGFPQNSKLAAVAGQTFVPIATPVTFAGVHQSVLDSLAPQFAGTGIMAVPASGGRSSMSGMKAPTETTLLGGDSVVVQLARGDIQIAAAGTVTLRDGEKIYAFGHPFFSLGSADLPMSESHVITVVPNANNSFKLAVPDAMVGAMTQDRATAIYGKLGQAPKMLPVKIRLTTSRGKVEEINYESAFDEFLTPLILSSGVSSMLAAHERAVGDSTIEVNGQINIRGEEPIRVKRRFAGAQAVPFASSATSIPMSALLRANFEGAHVTGVVIDMAARDASKNAVVDHITVDKLQVRPGETVEVSIFERTASGSFVVQKVPVKIASDTAPGNLTLTVGDGSAVQQNSAVTQIVPRTVSELVNTYNRLKWSDRLYAVLTRTTTGAVVGAKEMPNLPPSVLATLNNDRTAGGTKALVQKIVSEVQLPESDFIVSGSQSLTIEVIR
jgi:hypothetical protein